MSTILDIPLALAKVGFDGRHFESEPFDGLTVTSIPG